MSRPADAAALLALASLLLGCTSDGLAPTGACGPTCDGASGADLVLSVDMHIEGCGTGPECAAPQLCVNGSCLAPASMCQTIADCPAANLCVNGFCIAGGCSGDVDCSSGGTCVTGHCVAASRSCAVTGDCPTGEVCLSGLCVSRSNCARDSDCASGFGCIGGDCVFLGACKTDADCPQNDICFKGGTCIHIGNQGCVVGGNGMQHCPQGEVCVARCPNGPSSCGGGVCTAVPECYPPGSFLQMACPQGQICVQGKCQAENMRWVCRSSGDCLVNQNCVGGACVAACVVDDPCEPLGEVCVFGICQNPVACGKNSDCPPRETCVAGVCRSSIECLKDGDCPMGRRCAAQQCI